MNIDPTINVGDILTVLVIMTAVVTLYFHARSVRISERQLETEIEDLALLSKETKEFAHQLKNEGEIRENMAIENMNKYAELLTYSNHIYGEAMMYHSANQYAMHEHMITLVLSVKALMGELMKIGKYQHCPETMILLEKTLKYMVDFMLVSDEWSNELQRVSEESEARRKKLGEGRRPGGSTAELIADENSRLGQQINEISMKYGILVEQPRDLYRASYVEIAKAMSFGCRKDST